ncbi:MAG TPA: hypothetical protein VMH40_05580 [Myxococcaceae bacterium]|nr:hypothetical protein [Myxococcaceae bacterium]
MHRLVVLASGAALVALAACGSSSGNPGGGGPDGGLTTPFTPPFTPSSTEIAKSIRVTFSGETLGVSGLPYTDCNNTNPFFVDGWSLFIDEYLVVIDNIRLNATPGNIDQTNVGASVATSKGGPWVIDMHKPQGFVGKDGTEPAGALYLFTQADNGSAFDPSVKYAFSYDIVQAKSGAVNVNLTDAQVSSDYQLMVSKGYTKLVRGRAVFAGTPGYSGNTTADTNFRAIPTTLNWVFGWDDHGSAINCINPDFGLEDTDPAARGIQVIPTGAVIAQITLHVDHIFWDKLRIEGTPLRFDPVAAWFNSGNSAASPLDLATLGKPLATTFADGTPLPDRATQQPTASCLPSGDQPNPAQVVLDPGGVPSSAVSNLADFMAFSAQSQMHLNADGICFIVGQQSPFYSPGLPK